MTSRTLPCILICLAWSAHAIAQESVTLTNRDSRATSLTPAAEPVFLSFTADPGTRGGDVFHVLVTEPGVAITLLTPSGTEITAANAGAQGYRLSVLEGAPGDATISAPFATPGFHTLISLPPAAATGEYKVKATPTDLATDAAIVATYTSSSQVRAGIVTGLDTYRAGDRVGFTGIFFDGSDPLPAVNASVRIQCTDDPSSEPVDLPLEEAGTEAGDGHYFAFWTPPAPGRYIAAMKATGNSSSGAAFSRFASTGFRVLPELARITSIQDSAVDTTGDGRPDRIAISFALDVTTPGRYRLLFNLRAAEAKVPGRVTAALAEGPARIEAAFPLEQLRPLNAGGPFAIADVNLIRLDSADPVTADHKPDAGSTAPYPLTVWLRSSPSLLTSSAATIPFGDVETGTSRELELTLRNNSAYPFTETELRLPPAPFAVLTPSSPFTVPAGGEVPLRVRFSPQSPGAQSATLNVAGLTIALSGNGVAPRTVSISVAPTLLDFGQVTTGQTRDLNLSIRNNGAAALAVRSIASSSPRYTVLRTTPFPVAAGAVEIVVVRFAPTAAAAANATLAITSDDPASPTIQIELRGAGIAPVVTQTILQIDDGTFEFVVGLPQGGVTAYFVNRLTPPRYPATLRSVQIFIDRVELPRGTSITVLAAPNQSGSQMTGLSFSRTTAQVTAADAFQEFEVPPLTIQSGDFVVGFSMVNPRNVFPAALDGTEPFRQRSYISTDGVNFRLIDNDPQLQPGNLGIRARIE